jgi:glycosyltransferase involved in cell wall biosynthesis
MKILLIHNDYQQAGGERTAVAAQVSLLRDNGHEVVLYTRDNDEIDGYAFFKKASIVPDTFFSRRTYAHIKKLVAEHRPDVAHVHNVFPLISPAAYYALKRCGVPVVQTLHNYRFLCPNGLFYTQGEICQRCMNGQTLHAVRLKCYRQSYALSALYASAIGLHRRWGTFALIDRFVALTEFSARLVLESGLATRDRISILGNFLPDPLPEAGSFEARGKYALYLGRLSAEKGVDVLLAAMAHLPGQQLRIAGDGPQRDELEAMVRHLNLRSVDFVGNVAGEAKWQLLREAALVVVPSRWFENFPFVVLESLAAGTPVVASDAGSLPYVLEDGRNALLFGNGDSLDLAQKVDWLGHHPAEALAMGRYGRTTIEQSYSAPVFIEALLSIYRQVSTPKK